MLPPSNKVPQVSRTVARLHRLAYFEIGGASMLAIRSQVCVYKYLTRALSQSESRSGLERSVLQFATFLIPSYSGPLNTGEAAGTHVAVTVLTLDGHAVAIIKNSLSVQLDHKTKEKKKL